MNTVLYSLREHHAEDLLNETFFREETTIEVKKEALKDVLCFLKESSGFEVLMDLTAVDYSVPNKQVRLVYWLHHPVDYFKIRIVTFVGTEDLVPSVSCLWPGAAWYERELYDLFGVSFEGHPDLKRILMPDDWQGHPLRKDYPLTEQKVAFKNEAKPKIPSQILHLKQHQKL